MNGVGFRPPSEQRPQRAQKDVSAFEAAWRSAINFTRRTGGSSNPLSNCGSPVFARCLLIGPTRYALQRGARRNLSLVSRKAKNISDMTRLPRHPHGNANPINCCPEPKRPGFLNFVCISTGRHAAVTRGEA